MTFQRKTITRNVGRAITALTVLCLVAVSFPAREGEYDAVQVLAEKAGQGNAESQFHLAWAYLDGRGVKADEERARALLLQSAGQNYPYAISAYAKLLRENAARNPDFADIAKWNKRSAVLGDASAQYMMGVIATESLSPEMAGGSPAQWFEKAAKAGYGPAMVQLGGLYERRMEYTKAYEWYVKAQETGEAKADLALADLTMFGNGTEKDPPKAFEYLKGAADKGLPVAQYNLGRAYLSGKYGVIDPVEAGQWFKRAGAQGMASAIYALRQNRKKCLSAPVFDDDVMRSCFAALPLNDGAVDFTIAAFYDKGYGVKQDPDKRNDWLRSAALNGYQEAVDAILGIGFGADENTGFEGQELYSWTLIYKERARRQNGTPDLPFGVYQASAERLASTLDPIEIFQAKRESKERENHVFKECPVTAGHVAGVWQKVRLIF